MRKQDRARTAPAIPPDPSDPFRLLDSLPRRVTRPEAARLLKAHFFEVSPRSLERWPVPVRVLNGRAHMETRALFEEARRRLEAAAPQ